MSVNNNNKGKNVKKEANPEIKEQTLEEKVLLNSNYIVKISQVLNQNATVINQMKDNIALLDERVKLFKESVDLLKERIEIEILKNKT